MDVSAIVALDVNYGIGHKGGLPWHIPADMRRFKKLTSGHSVIMGRKTFDSLPNGALPDRENIVLTRNKDFQPDGVVVFHSPNDVLKYLDPEKKYFVIGGQEIYNLFFHTCTKLYMTYIFREFETDKTFTFRPSYWTLESEEIIKNDPELEYNFPYSFQFYKRKKLKEPKKRESRKDK